MALHKQINVTLDLNRQPQADGYLTQGDGVCVDRFNKLRAVAERSFPTARLFVRPGFDDESA